jgi:hypothetical protein
MKRELCLVAESTERNSLYMERLLLLLLLLSCDSHELITFFLSVFNSIKHITIITMLSSLNYVYAKVLLLQPRLLSSYDGFVAYLLLIIISKAQNATLNFMRKINFREREKKYYFHSLFY